MLHLANAYGVNRQGRHQVDYPLYMDCIGMGCMGCIEWVVIVHIVYLFNM